MKFIILFSCLLPFLGLQAHAQYELMLRECDYSENYTSNSQFQTNLNLLLQSLRSNGARDGFFNSSTGSVPDTVYGVVQCRGDVSGEDCQTCLNEITVDITQRCPRRKEATLRYSYCLLRYSNQRFFSQVDRRWWALLNTRNVSDESLVVDIFNLILGDLMTNLSRTAASRQNRYDSRPNRYDSRPVTGRIDDTSFSLYGTVQCNRDLSPTGCRSCLQSMISWIPDCCNSKQGARIYSTTCDIRCEIYPFIENQPVSPPPPLRPPSSPPLTERGNETGKDKSTNVVAIIVLPVFASLLLLSICGLLISKKIVKNRRKTKRDENYPIKCTYLSWERRYKIIGGIARGLVYLHEDSRHRIIHRDLKVGNVLLDEHMEPKISNFGMSRLFKVDQTQGTTARIVGTYGYMAPEYAMHGQFSVKSDVFSFGVLVLEIITGQKNKVFFQSKHVEDLLSYAWRHWGEGRALELIEPALKGEYSVSEVMRSIHIALLCVQEDAALRPRMATVVNMLETESAIIASPLTPAFFVNSREHVNNGESKVDSAKLLSANELFLTEMHPR